MDALIFSFVTGSLIALGIMLHILKMGPKRIFGYDIYFDLFLSCFLMFMFHGTQGGMILAALGGLFISIFLRLGRWIFGYQRIGIAQKEYKAKIFGKLTATTYLPTVAWKEYPSLFAKDRRIFWVNPEYAAHPPKQ